MDRIAQAPQEERAELFRRSAGILRPERSPAIIEKDFWVCWSLYRLFDVLRFQPQLIFKGGTSLSKAYHAVERFSEDVDLSLSRRDLGFADSRDPEEPGISGKEARGADRSPCGRVPPSGRGTLVARSSGRLRVRDWPNRVVGGTRHDRPSNGDLLLSAE